jgi:hypothetical protein
MIISFEVKNLCQRVWVEKSIGSPIQRGQLLQRISGITGVNIAYEKPGFS